MKEEQVNEFLNPSPQSERTNRMDDFVRDHVEQWDLKKRSKHREDIEPELPTVSAEQIAPTVPTESTEPPVAPPPNNARHHWMSIGSSFSELRRLPTANPYSSAVLHVTASTKLSVGSVNVE